MDPEPVASPTHPSPGAVEFAPADSHLPRPLRQRDGVALCLSGGGYRAALFHLGALRRLNELSALSRVTTITSVSGGSILAGQLAGAIGDGWPEPGTAYDDWDRVESSMRDFCRLNIRTLPILVGALPWNLLNSAKPIQELIERYRADLVNLPLAQLPDRPQYVFCATDMTYGVNWICSKDRIGSWQAGYVDPADTRFDVATAVGASSCFPPIFDPLPIGIAPGKLRGGRDRGPRREERVRGLRLADGGLYDNMGLEPVWRTHEYVLVSEGGSTFDPEGDRGLFWRLSRYVNVMGNQVGALRKRWLIDSFLDPDDNRSLQGTYWGIGSLTRRYEERPEDVVPGYPDELVGDVISEVRTDLDRFTDAEMNVLINHGYLLAEAATRRWTPALRAGHPPLRVPFPDYMDPDRVARELAESHKRRLPFGRR